MLSSVALPAVLVRMDPVDDHATRVSKLSTAASARATSSGLYRIAPLALALVFLNPVYFMLLCLEDLRSRQRVLALLGGAAACLLVHPLLPDWSLLLAGLGGGSAGFLLGRRR